MTIGVLVAALADRIRGLRISREVAPRERESRASSIPASTARGAIPVVAHAELLQATTKQPPRVFRAEPKIAATPPDRPRRGAREDVSQRTLDLSVVLALARGA